MGDNDNRLHPASGFVAACPKLTELTVVFPYPHCVKLTEAGVPLDPRRESAHSAISELAVACKALPDFDTFQIVRIPTVMPYLRGQGGWWEFDNHIPPVKPLGQALRGQTKDLKDWTTDCLKPGTGRRERKRRKTITLRVINFSPGDRSEWVEEYEV